MEKYIISVEGNLTSFVFYNELLGKLHEYYESGQKKEVLFDFTKIESIDSLVIPNLLCVCHIIKVNSEHVPTMMFSENISDEKIRRYINDINFVKIGKKFNLIKFQNAECQSSHSVESLDTTTYFNSNEDEILTWSRMTVVVDEFLRKYNSKDAVQINPVERSLLMEISNEIVSNSIKHGKSFVFVTMHYNKTLKRLKLSFSDCGMGFYNTMMQKGCNVENNIDAIIQGLYTRKAEDVYGLYSVIKRILLYKESVVRIHSSDTQIIFTNNLLTKFAELNDASQYVKELQSASCQKNVKQNVKYAGVHIEFDINLAKQGV